MKRTGPLAVIVIVVAALLLSATASVSADTTDHLRWDRASVREIYQPPDRFYSYAPSVVRDKNTTWVWSCHNAIANQVKDHIYLTKIVDGSVVEDRSVLEASPAPAWDSFHTCDPSVVKGHFHYRQDAYSYALFYLGNDLDASAHNQIGVAFAKSPEGPWVKYPRPIVSFDRTDQWGVGQPSAVQFGRSQGKVLLFYTRGDTSTRAYVSKVDLSNPIRVKVREPTLVPTDGLTGWDGSPDWLNGFDAAYDQSRHEFHVVREQHPYPIDNPWWIGPSVQVDAMDTSSLLAGRGTWQVEGNVDKALTGLDRNHNAGLVRDWYGNLLKPNALDVVFTSSCSSLPTVYDQDWSQATCDSLYSYHLWEVDGVLG